MHAKTRVKTIKWIELNAESRIVNSTTLYGHDIMSMYGKCNASTAFRLFISVVVVVICAFHSYDCISAQHSRVNVCVSEFTHSGGYNECVQCSHQDIQCEFMFFFWVNSREFTMMMCVRYTICVAQMPSLGTCLP